MTDLVFHDDWFSRHVPTWEKFLSHLKGNEYIQGLEVGCWEGRSTCWLLQNVFTHPTSKITCVDTFQGNPENVIDKHHSSVQQTFQENVQKLCASERIDLKVQRSGVALKYMHDNHFDFVYLDGSHITADVLTDIVLAWPLVKKGGIVIMDDYEYACLPMDAVPRHAIDIFQLIHRKEIIELHRGWQMIWRKI